jgi:hypothetical protein
MVLVDAFAMTGSPLVLCNRSSIAINTFECSEIESLEISADRRWRHFRSLRLMHMSMSFTTWRAWQIWRLKERSLRGNSHESRRFRFKWGSTRRGAP